MRQTASIIGIVAAVAAVIAVPIGGLLAQESDAGFRNLQVLPPDIPKDDLKAIMEGFTEMLGVKCTHCHILDEYYKDDFEHKLHARKMIRLIDYLRDNSTTYFEDDFDPQEMTCWTCHRSEAEPPAFEPEDDDDWI
jgi:hypothetical protein